MVIDARFLKGQPSGFYVFCEGLIGGLRELKQVSGALPFDFVFLTSEPESALFRGFETRWCPIEFLSVPEIWRLGRYFDPLSDSLFYSPTFMSAVGLPVPHVQTIHDLNHLHYGSLAQKIYYELILKPFCRRARVLTTVSHFSQREIAGWLGVKCEQISIIPNSLNPPLWEDHPIPALPAGLQSGQYLLLPSSLRPHKNVGVVFQAFERFRSRSPEFSQIKLVCSFERPVPESEAHRSMDGVVFGSELKIESQTQWYGLVRSARAVLFPSEYEGFGLPPVEAAAAGVPAVVSDILPHREGLAPVPEGELTWIAPHDIDAWDRAINDAALNRLPNTSLASRANLRERWSRIHSAERLVATIKNALSL